MVAKSNQTEEGNNSVLDTNSPVIAFVPSWSHAGKYSATPIYYTPNLFMSLAKVSFPFILARLDGC